MTMNGRMRVKEDIGENERISMNPLSGYELTAGL